jgi:hypothetical protein
LRGHHHPLPTTPLRHKSAPPSSFFLSFFLQQTIL